MLPRSPRSFRILITHVRRCSTCAQLEVPFDCFTFHSDMKLMNIRFVKHAGHSVNHVVCFELLTLDILS